MMIEEERPPTWLRDGQRLGFWLGVAVVLHLGWLYLLQSTVPSRGLSWEREAAFTLVPTAEADRLRREAARFYEPAGIGNAEWRRLWEGIWISDLPAAREAAETDGSAHDSH